MLININLCMWNISEIILTNTNFSHWCCFDMYVKCSSPLLYEWIWIFLEKYSNLFILEHTKSAIIEALGLSIYYILTSNTILTAKIIIILNYDRRDRLGMYVSESRAHLNRTRRVVSSPAKLYLAHFAWS